MQAILQLPVSHMRAIGTRHYKTIINAAGEILGWGDSPPNDDWEDDVRFVDKTLRKNEIKFKAVYSSMLERSRKTAMFHARRHGIKLIYDSPALNEVNYGELYKKKKKWVAEQYPQHKKDPDLVYPGGESFREMQHRSVSYFGSLAAAHTDDTILLVVHAGVIRGLICHFLGLDYATNLKRKISHRYIGEFVFEGDVCGQYNELGRPSGFVRDRVIEIPCKCPVQVEAIAAQQAPGQL